MRVTHYARRSLSAAVLALALAACGKDNGPSEFNPQGTAADMAAAQDAFASEQTASFAAVGLDISAALNGSPFVAGSAALALTRPSASSARYARQLAALVPRRRPRHPGQRGRGPVRPARHHLRVGRDHRHATSPRTCPARRRPGVRFQLYAIDPVTLHPVEPVVEVGYVDVIDQSTDRARPTSGSRWSRAAWCTSTTT